MSFGTGALTQEEFEIAIETNARIFLVDINIELDQEFELYQKNISHKNYKLLHHLIDDLETITLEKNDSDSQSQILSHEEGTVTGKAQILRRIMLTKKKEIAGVRITEGVWKIGDRFRIVRDGEIVAYDVTLKEMKNGPKSVKETPEGKEAGVSFNGDVDFEEGDLIEIYA